MKQSRGGLSCWRPFPQRTEGKAAVKPQPLWPLVRVRKQMRAEKALPSLPTPEDSRSVFTLPHPKSCWVRVGGSAQLRRLPRCQGSPKPKAVSWTWELALAREVTESGVEKSVCRVINPPQTPHPTPVKGAQWGCPRRGGPWPKVCDREASSRGPPAQQCTCAYTRPPKCLTSSPSASAVPSPLWGGLPCEAHQVKPLQLLQLLLSGLKGHTWVLGPEPDSQALLVLPAQPRAAAL